MKIFFSILLLMSVQFSVFSQKINFEETMKKQIDKLFESESIENMETQANTFDRISNAEPEKWEPCYYAAYCNIMQAFKNKDVQKTDALIDQAEKLIEKGLLINPKNDELLCLSSMAQSARIGVDPQTRGMKYGPKATELLNTAKSINPNNPRIYLLLGQNLLYTPEMWGGGKQKAKAQLDIAKEKFLTFKPLSIISPNWGNDYCDMLISNTK